MIKYSSVILLIFINIPLCYSQIRERHKYFQTNFSDINTYRISHFEVNKEVVDPGQSSNISYIESNLHKALYEKGYEQAENPDIWVILNLKIDTLGIGKTREVIKPGDILADFKIEFVDPKSMKRIFVGDVKGLLVADEKRGKTLKKIYDRFFIELPKKN